MHDQWTDRLSEYLDDDMSPLEREALESHLERCGECAAVLLELRAVVQQAQRLGELTPERDLWPGIAERVQQAPRGTGRGWSTLADKLVGRARISLTVPQLAALAATLVAATAAVVVLSRDAGVEVSPAGTEATPAVRLANFADPQYDAAVADLKRALEAGRDQLDPQTVAVLERNLAIIDGAIAQAREALRADPANTYLNAYLADARRRKLALLRQATGLADLAG